MRTHIEASLAALSKSRPVFHSEADFQFALAWEFQKQRPDADVRLERPVEMKGKKGHADIWIGDNGVETVLELKYWTRHLQLVRVNESFELKDQGARDVRLYDLWKDVERVEGLVSGGPAKEGYVLAVTNDPPYWSQDREDTYYAQFRASEDRDVHGTLSWDTRAAEGTTRGRTDNIVLKARYTANWKPYAQPSNERYGEFRYLLLDIGEALSLLPTS